jgi:hypothetical protein
MKVKVHFSFKHHAINMYGGSVGRAPCIFDLGSVSYDHILEVGHPAVT